ncbi:MAG: glutamate racemase [Anaerolineaceae bacterium]|nr:glutamate racemase [Anaerolineaceae bacterium]HPR35809.1 glutamate racemase [Anaerolineaceae bacterium]
MTNTDAPIGVYDSGVGGLSVLRAIHNQLPSEATLYFADQAKVPYGERPLEEVRQLAEGVTRMLMSQGAKLIVIACNTASAAALKHLRALYPEFPFVGMEPAVKPAAEQTLSGKVGVLATPSTFQGELYASVVERFAKDVQIYEATCPGLVKQIERGYLNTYLTRGILQRALQPMLAEGVDTLVMGCTHFPFVIPLIQQIAGENVRVIDPAPAIARQTERVLIQQYLTRSSSAEPAHYYLTSGDPTRFSRLLEQLLGVQTRPEKWSWVGDSLRHG